MSPPPPPPLLFRGNGSQGLCVDGLRKWLTFEPQAAGRPRVLGVGRNQATAVASSQAAHGLRRRMPGSHRRRNDLRLTPKSVPQAGGHPSRAGHSSTRLHARRSASAVAAFSGRQRMMPCVLTWNV